MALRVKRTFNLTPRTVEVVRDLTELYHVATSQDAVIDLAVSELRRLVLDREEAALWARAAIDCSLETWPPDAA